MKQLELLKQKCHDKFGGELLIGKRKERWPLTTQKPIHLIFRLKDDRLKFLCSPLNPESVATFKSTLEQFNIQVRGLAFNYTHVHLIIRLQNQSDYTKFVCARTYRLTFLTRRKFKELGKESAGKLFDLRPYTRIVSWGRDWRGVQNYMLKNRFESGVPEQLEIYAKA